jgi:hypothetical protein
LKVIDRCPGRISFFKSPNIAWAECQTCKRRWYEGDGDRYKDLAEKARTIGLQLCLQDHVTLETIHARVKVLEKAIVALCQGDADGKAT